MYDPVQTWLIQSQVDSAKYRSGCNQMCPRVSFDLITQEMLWDACGPIIFTVCVQMCPEPHMKDHLLTGREIWSQVVTGDAFRILFTFFKYIIWNSLF